MDQYPHARSIPMLSQSVLFSEQVPSFCSAAIHVLLKAFAQFLIVASKSQYSFCQILFLSAVLINLPLCLQVTRQHLSQC
jgi:hypothetical protein